MPTLNVCCNELSFILAVVHGNKMKYIPFNQLMRPIQLSSIIIPIQYFLQNRDKNILLIHITYPIVIGLQFEAARCAISFVTFCLSGFFKNRKQKWDEYNQQENGHSVAAMITAEKCNRNQEL